MTFLFYSLLPALGIIDSHTKNWQFFFTRNELASIYLESSLTLFFLPQYLQVVTLVGVKVFVPLDFLSALGS